jgi:two-component system sensor histidine kinase and response regulator WspE
MIPPQSGDLSGFSMMELFRQETETQVAIIVEGLLALEQGSAELQRLEALMRAAHSLKGAARLVNLDEAVKVAHAIEDCFVAAQKGQLQLSPERIDLLLKGADLLSRIAQQPEVPSENQKQEIHREVQQFLDLLKASLETAPQSPPAAVPLTQDSPTNETAHVLKDAAALPEEHSEQSSESENRAATENQRLMSRAPVRVAADQIDRLMRLAGESVVAARWVETFNRDLQKLKRLQSSLTASLSTLNESLISAQSDVAVRGQVAELKDKQVAFSQTLIERIAELEQFERRFNNLSGDLYHGVLDCRMRPFAEGVQGLPRMVRDVARSLGKTAELTIRGEDTPVDREVLELIESPLGHLLRNAIDHGLESPDERVRQGKPPQGHIRLEARHFAGQLHIIIEDDGRGIDLSTLKQTLVNRQMVTSAMSESLTQQELFEFLFLPGFSLKSSVTEVSGRGVGLDAVQTAIKKIGGVITITSQLHQGTKFELQLPLTLSVVRTLLVEIAGEPFAFPLARVNSVFKLPQTQVESVEGRQHFVSGGSQIGLVLAHEILGQEKPSAFEDELAVVILGDAAHQYGVVVDGFLGERELVVRPLDPRLGKIQDISAAALMPDQSPVLIIDVEDFIHSIRHMASGRRLAQVSQALDTLSGQRRKRVLVVDDSLTVRELERKLIAGRGYEVEVAVDGMDAWNAVRSGHYDLIVTDVDMPRLDGIELVTLIKRDARLNSLPVMIVSYKDREEDHRRGLEAGADYYLTKASFHDETLLTAIEDLIGAAVP